MKRSVLSWCLGVLVVLLPARAEVAPIRDWEWIIIHHSATRMGSAEIFDAAHRSRGMINGLAYHFVIDNGTEGKADGFIETGSRWVKQMHGGHCRQPYINERGIGICLVGNFSKDQPTVNQLDSLALLIRGLQDQFHIPNDHVLGHGEVIGEFSECPGKEFPWEEVRKRLTQASLHPDPLPTNGETEETKDLPAPKGRESRIPLFDLPSGETIKRRGE